MISMHARLPAVKRDNAAALGSKYNPDLQMPHAVFFLRFATEAPWSSGSAPHPARPVNMSVLATVTPWSRRFGRIIST